MGVVNTPTNAKEVPDQAKGNPIYEQTRQDMPLFCCGKNCGRNSRVTVFALATIGILCSCIVCISPNYFHYISTRVDTFEMEDNYQPIPFTYATEANVGLFRYQILDFHEYTWPDIGYDERKLFDEMHNRELERLKDGESSIFSRLLQKKFPDEFYDDDDSFTSNRDGSDDTGSDTGGDDEISIPSGNVTTYQNDTMEIVLTTSPAGSPTEIPIDQIPDVIPGSNTKNQLPTSMPTPQPSRSNPNDNYDLGDIDKVQSYHRGNELDKLFNNGRSGALWAPILAAIGLIFASIEFFCCVYKCSWLPTAISLYLAFMLQMMTLFLFMSEDFCTYRQDCTLGSAGFMSVIAVICYFICQILVCMTPRPPPKYNLLKKPPVRRKKKKKKRPKEFADDEKKSLSDQDRFADESSYYNNDSSRYLGDDTDPYDDPYSNQHVDDNSYSKGYDNDNSYSKGYDNDHNNGYDNANGYNDGYDNGYDDHDGGYDNTDQNGYDKNDQRSDNNGDQKGHGDENADQRGYDNDDQDTAAQRSYNKDEQAYDDQDTAAQRSHDNDSQMNGDHNEDNEQAPSSSKRKKKKKKKG